MGVEIFDTNDFRSVLQSFGMTIGAEYFDKSELCFDLPYKGINIHVRSSISDNGKSDGTGENSIRIYMRHEQIWLGKIDAYTTRVKGWQGRLQEKIELLKHYRDLSGDCPSCFQPMGVYKVKKEGLNKGRLFCKCEKDNGFYWLDEQRVVFFADGQKLQIDLDQRAVVTTSYGDLVVKREGEAEVITKPNGDVLSSELAAGLREVFMGMDVGSGPDQTAYSLQDILDSLPEDEEAPKGEPNEYQQAIIHAPLDQPMRVLAGPGSGKTFTISHRYAHMVINLGIVPSQIVVVTFNKLAADNMLKKIVEQCPIPPEAMNQICTIHALCNRALRSFYKEFSHLSMAAGFLIEKVLKGLLVNLEPVEESRPGWEEMLSWINTSKAHGIIPQEVANWFMSLHPDQHHSVGELLQNCRIGLEQALQAEGQWTFTDMLYEMEQALLTDSTFKAHWQAKFKYLIVDEAQDTAAQAIRILTLLFDHTNQIMMVGDGDQLLYRFTGATPENTLYQGFDERYPDNRTYMLPVNYRSTERIVDYSKQIILNNYQPLGEYDERFFKNMSARSDAAQGDELVLTHSLNPIMEARDALETVKRLIEDGYSPGDFFIGARTRAQIGYLEAAFAPSTIPYVNVVGTSFFDLPHVRHVLSYMQLVADPGNQNAFANIYNVASKNMTVPWSTAADYGDYCQHRFLTAEFLAAAKSFTGMQKLLSYRESVKPKASWKFGMQDLSDLMYELMASAEDGPAALVDAIVENCYRKYVTSQTGSKEEGTGEGGRLDDIATIKELAHGFDKLSDFIQYVDAVIASAKAAQNKDWDGRVVLATIHRLKGLERPVVIGVGMSEGVDGQSGLLPHTFALVDPPNQGKMPGNHKGKIADERCLIFVLISRAERMVILSSVDNYREKPMRPSRFLEELSLE